jgi:S1-C subfamily serine protease
MRLFVLMICGIIALIPSAHSSSTTTEYIKKDLSNIPENLRRLIPAVARIRDYRGGVGTGFYIGNGLVLTAGHNIAPANTSSVQLNPKEIGINPSGPQIDRGLQLMDVYNGDLSKISIHFGLTGPDRYMDIDTAGQYRPFIKDATGTLRDTAGRVVLEPNFQIEEVIDAKWGPNPPRDYAILRIRKPWPDVHFEIASANDNPPIVGEIVFSFGFWEGIDPKFGSGIQVIDTNGSYYGYNFNNKDGYMVDLHGSSGGPIMNASGRVIGIISTTVHGKDYGVPLDSFHIAMRPSTAFERKNCADLMN